MYSYLYSRLRFVMEPTVAGLATLFQTQILAAIAALGYNASPAIVSVISMAVLGLVFTGFLFSITQHLTQAAVMVGAATIGFILAATICQHMGVLAIVIEFTPVK